MGHVAVLNGVRTEQLSSLVLAEGFEVFADGDPARVVSLLRHVAATPRGHVRVAVSEGRIVGYCALAPPKQGDRFGGIRSACEVRAIEVCLPYRGRGLLGALLGRGEDARVMYVICDPASREPEEGVRAFRHRVISVFGSVGFFPMATDHSEVRSHRDAVFCVRIGRGVSPADADAFLTRLLDDTRRPTVAVYMRDAVLRDLVRTHLERNDFEVSALGTIPVPGLVSDAVVTESDDVFEAPVVVRVTSDDRPTVTAHSLWVPVQNLDLLPGILRSELGASNGHG